MRSNTLFVWQFLFLTSIASAAPGTGLLNGYPEAIEQTAAHEAAFTFSPRAREAYQQILSLRFIEARANLDALQRLEPGNLIAPFLENYLDFFTILVDDNREEYARRVRRMNPRLAQIARGDIHSPYYLYTQAEIRLQWGILRGRYGNYLSSLSDIRQAYALLEENQRRHPEFAANQKSLGILHALVGNIPDEYRWVVKALGGMGGTVDQGMQELKSVLVYAGQHDFVFEAETRTAYSFLLLHLKNDKTGAWQILSAGRLDPQTSPLAAFALANLAIRTGHNDEAIRILLDCPRGQPYHPFPYRDYLFGIAKLNRLDPDANLPLEAFVHSFRGENGIKEAYQKLAWFHLISGDKNGYRACMALIKSTGNDRAEPDKAALREARSGEMPDPGLTRARLLFDGGYYQRAFDLLNSLSGRFTDPGKSSLEYTYRLGRVTHEMGNARDAVRYYTQTIESGARQPWYFACNAAFQLGLLYEKQKNYDLASAAFRRCLEIKPEEYAASLHARAKAGLARVR